jgi:HTH-type transcriptional regulator/antitoxin HigA
MDIEDFRTPGQLLEFLLKERGWTQKVLSVILGVEVTAINRIISGKRPVTAEMAILLSELFDTVPETFLELQKRYDLAKAQITLKPDPGRATRASLFGDLPISEMIKRGWLDAKDVRNVPEVEAALIKFFGEDSVDEIEILPHAAKKTNTFAPATPPQIAWIYRVKKIAEDMIVGRYSHSAARNAVSRLSNLLSAPTEARKVPRIMAECGIRFVIVESLASAKIDGACFWLNDASPVVGMSLRYDRIDNFWFVLRHEIEHVLNGHGRDSTIMLDAELEGNRAGIGEGIAEEERIANEAAAEFCVPQATLGRFIARKSPFFREIDILGFANTLKIHPGLIAGQLQHRTERYDLFRQHLVKIRSSVTPTAMVDGWGDVAPAGL